MASAPLSPHERPRDRPVVLVVDDDDGLRDALHLTLDEEYAVVDAAHGRTALSMVRSERVDLVLLDILMPDVDGLEILQELKALEPDLPVIMLTGHDDIASIDRAYQLGANSFATKPVNWRQLSYHIRYVVRTSRPQGPQQGSARY